MESTNKPATLLQRVAAVSCSAFRKFEARENFTVDTSKKAKVQVCSFGVEFVRYCHA
jgi:hypothetical protein